MWALGAALGAKVAAPDKTVVSVMTDGGFVWGSPVAALWSSIAYNAPFLSVIFNNQSYAAIKRLVRGGYGEEVLPDDVAFETGVDIVPPIDYTALAASLGAWSRMVVDPAEIATALKEGMAAVKAGRPAVMDVRLQR